MDEEQSASLLLKIKPWLESGGPFQERTAQPASEQDEPTFSALDLRDRVVLALLEENTVRVDQVETAWTQWKSETQDVPDALWRVVAQLPEVDAESVFATAAEVYAFESAASILYRSQALLETYRGRFSLKQRRRLVALNVLPVATENSREGTCWIFATHDPARPAVHRLLADVEVPNYDLRYAPAAEVRSYLEEVFPGEVALETRGADGKPTPTAPSEEAAAKKPPAADPAEEKAAPPSFLDALFDEKEEPSASAAQRGRETARTFASIYEELIAGVARSGARRVRLSAQAGDQLVATFDFVESGEQRSVELEVLPEAVLSFMRRRTRSTRRSGREGERRVHRWVEGKRHSFRIAALPDRTRWKTGRGEIVIEATD